MRLPEMLGTKPVQPICTGAFTHVAGVTTCNKIGTSGVPAFGFGFDVIERTRSPQRLPTIRTFIPPKVKDMLPESGFRLTFIEEFRALDVVFHTGTAL